MNHYCVTLLIMFAHVLVLLCGCAYALSAVAVGRPPNPVPDYLAASVEWQKLVKNLNENFMNGTGGEHLDSPERHHIVIFNVINEEALVQSGCVHVSYDEDYQPRLETSAPFALYNPEQVISAGQQLVDSVNNWTANVSVLLNCIGTHDGCNEWINNAIKENKEALEPEAKLLLAAGEAASNLNKQNVLYTHIADNLGSLEFVLKGQEVLKNPTLALAEVYKIISWVEVIEC